MIVEHQILVVSRIADTYKDTDPSQVSYEPRSVS